MEDKIKVQMFGIKDEIVKEDCGWGPSTDCGPSEDQTSMEMFTSLYDFLKQTDVKEKFEMTFIDIEESDLSQYADAKKVIDKGYQLPITFIGGKPAFSGKVDSYKAYRVLQKM